MELGTLEEQVRRYVPKHTKVSDAVVLVIQHVLCLCVEMSKGGVVRGIDTRKRLQTCGGLLARYLRVVELVWGGVSVGEAHELFDLNLIGWWVSEQPKTPTSDERSLSRLCGVWTADDPAQEHEKLRTTWRNRPFRVKVKKPETAPLTPAELRELFRWITHEPNPFRRERATLGVAVALGAGLVASQRETVTKDDCDSAEAFVVIDGEQIPVRPECRAALVSVKGFSPSGQRIPFANMTGLGFTIIPTRLIDTWVVLQLCEGVAVDGLEKRVSYAQIYRAVIVALGSDLDYSDVTVPAI